MPLDPSLLPGARRAADMPRFVPPELATLVEKAPQGEGWSHEIKFDGYRVLARIESGVAELHSRSDKDWTAAYGVLADELAALPVDSAILDGEVVAQSPNGVTSFEELRHVARVVAAEQATRKGGGSTSIRAASQTGTARLLYYAFDLLFLNGYDLIEAPLEERRGLLKRLLAPARSTDRIRFSDHIAGDGATVLEQACRLGLEGVVSKKAGSPYRPGMRGPDWVKAKCRQKQEFVIGGFTDPAGTRVGFGALLLGVSDTGGLRYVSRVGTGFDDALLVSLGRRLRDLEIDDPPFSENLPKDRRGVHWVRPELVAQVSFMEWTGAGGIRHPSFKGLREDKPALEVVAERPVKRAAVESPTPAPPAGPTSKNTGGT